jgi:hypothetical protein
MTDFQGVDVFEVNRSAYAAAQELIRRGVWSIDPERGLLSGANGEPVTYTRPGLRDNYVRCTPAGHHSIAVHRVIWECVHGPIPDGMVINHLNGMKDDNRLANLELVTQRENNIHAYSTGLNKRRAPTECRTHGTEFWTTRVPIDGVKRYYCKECNRLRMARKRAAA